MKTRKNLHISIAFETKPDAPRTLEESLFEQLGFPLQPWPAHVPHPEDWHFVPPHGDGCGCDQSKELVELLPFDSHEFTERKGGMKGRGFYTPTRTSLPLPPGAKGAFHTAFETHVECNECKEEWFQPYMLTDETFVAAAATCKEGVDELLCLRCVEKRLGRELVAEDFEADAEVNDEVLAAMEGEPS